MRFLLDQDVYASTAHFLISDGHDVVQAAQLGLSQAPDQVLLQTAMAQRRILVTRDRDYGGLVFVQGIRSAVIYLRILPSTEERVHRQLEIILARHTEAEITSAFLVVEAEGYRLRHLSFK